MAVNHASHSAREDLQSLRNPPSSVRVGVDCLDAASISIGELNRTRLCAPSASTLPRFTGSDFGHVISNRAAPEVFRGDLQSETDQTRWWDQSFSVIRGFRARGGRDPQREDRRIQKTQNLMRQVLLALIAEKPYYSIVVKEILDRANVGRSTFCTHFLDEDDLLLSGIHEMLGPVPAPARGPGKNRERILWFSLPVFEHHYRQAHAWDDRIGSRGRAILHERLRRVLAEIIAETMEKDSQHRRQSARQIPPEVLAAFVASTFVVVLNWWTDKRMRMPPKEINDIFRRLTSPDIGGGVRLNGRPASPRCCSSTGTECSNRAHTTRIMDVCYRQSDVMFSNFTNHRSSPKNRLASGLTVHCAKTVSEPL